jgi:hypothetical protein
VRGCCNTSTAQAQEAHTLCMESWTVNPARTAAEADALIELVTPIFAICALGDSDDFIGIEIKPDRAGTLRICLERKALAFAYAFLVAGERRALPMSLEIFGELRAACDGDMADAEAYNLASAACCTLRLADIALPLGALATYCSAPTVVHFAAMLDADRYMGSTANRGMTFGLLRCLSRFGTMRSSQHARTPVAARWGGLSSCMAGQSLGPASSRPPPLHPRWTPNIIVVSCGHERTHAPPDCVIVACSHVSFDNVIVACLDSVAHSRTSCDTGGRFEGSR